MTAPVRTTCPYCGVGCGVLATPQDDGAALIAGDPDHPANFGRLCSKGSALGETLGFEGRLLRPHVRGRPVAWDLALDLVAANFTDTISKHGPESVAFYLSGQLLTEDYYVANKLMKGFIGAANVDTNSRLCMASSVAGHKRAFGADTVPGCYEDVELAELVVLVGSNLSWCHPVLHQRLMAARARTGAKLAVIDPRVTDTAATADLHLAIAPGSDVALFNGLLLHLARTGRIDRAYVEAHTSGLEAALAEAEGWTCGEVARAIETPADLVRSFFDLFQRVEKVVTIYSQGVNQSTSGSDKVNAILNCHLATGRIGRPGMGPFSVTGQPNAMGGREVGGLANTLAAHMELDNPDHRRVVEEFWRAPRLAEKPGLKAVDLFRAVRDGSVKALWIMASNPVDSMPKADLVREALTNCPFVVVSDVARETDTTRFADVLLPSAAWGEKECAVTNSERRISRQRAFLAMPGEARPDWRQICEVARRMGFGAGFAFDSAAEIFAEHCALTTVANDGARDLDLGALADMPRTAYDALEPVQWPLRKVERTSVTRFFAQGGFYHPDGRARFVPTRFKPPASATDSSHPLILNTGRIRDQWHTMTRTGRSARLMAHIAEPFVEMHPRDAKARGLAPADLARISSRHGSVVLRVLITEAQRPGSVFAPIHWTDAHSSNARIGALIGDAVDDVSGQPELKWTPVEANRFPARWYGFAVSTQALDVRTEDYVALARAKAGWRAEFASLTEPRDWDEHARLILAPPANAHWLVYADEKRGSRRFAATLENKLVCALFVSSEPTLVARSWLSDTLGAPLSGADRLSLLGGWPSGQKPDRGPVICACYETGRNEILDAIGQGCDSLEQIGARLKAGTNCGSCRIEIVRLLAQSSAPAAASSTEPAC